MNSAVPPRTVEEAPRHHDRLFRFSGKKHAVPRWSRPHARTWLWHPDSGCSRDDKCYQGRAGSWIRHLVAVMYQMLPTVLPLVTADVGGDPLEWVHCHIARQPIAPVDGRTVPEPLSAITMRLLAKNAEERYQSRLGPGSRSAAMPDGTAVAWSHRSIPSGHGRPVGPIVDTREAVWEEARGKCSSCGVRSGCGAWHRRTSRALRIT